MAVDPATEWRELQERYSTLSDGELEELAGEAYQLTDTAKEVLKSALRSRGLDVELAKAPPEDEEFYDDSDELTEEESDSESFDPADLELAPVLVAWSVEEARAAKLLLNNAGIPSYLGPDNVEKVEEVERNFARGVEVKTRYVDRHRAGYILQHEMPKSAEDRVDPEAIPEVDIRCPSCNSDAVIFEQLEKESPKDSDLDATFHWRCDACGHEWEDDGVDR
ncbi:MAG TPA: hypothetical protein VN577_21115 [Terriglobales bacterium]|nr:hypothetical protein [Terriglobales bacterium]